jgi:hypothetical protein
MHAVDSSSRAEENFPDDQEAVASVADTPTSTLSAATASITTAETVPDCGSFQDDVEDNLDAAENDTANYSICNSASTNTDDEGSEENNVDLVRNAGSTLNCDSDQMKTEKDAADTTAFPSSKKSRPSRASHNVLDPNEPVYTGTKKYFPEFIIWQVRIVCFVFTFVE